MSKHVRLIAVAGAAAALAAGPAGSAWAVPGAPHPGGVHGASTRSAAAGSDASSLGAGGGPVTNYPGFLLGVSAASASNAWAVGWTSGTENKTLLLRWNGTRWRRVPSPNPGGRNGSFLSGVSAVSSSDAWADGYYYTTAQGASKSLLLHWNGTHWTRVTVPGTGLAAVSADSGTDAWAAGDQILHWNGIGWRQVTRPNPVTPADTLYDISAASRSNVWAVGAHFTSGGTQTGLVLHWNGTRWQNVIVAKPAPGAAELFGVSALSATDAWIAGSGPSGPPGAGAALLLRWNGTRWRQAATPNPGGPNGSSLLGVTAVSPSDAWAVGAYNTPRSLTQKTLMLHWNGTSWAPIASPTPSIGSQLRGGQLNAVATVSPSDAWAVGSYFYGNGANGGTLLLHWNGRRWTRS